MFPKISRAAIALRRSHSHQINIAKISLSASVRAKDIAIDSNAKVSEKKKFPEELTDQNRIRNLPRGSQGERSLDFHENNTINPQTKKSIKMPLRSKVNNPDVESRIPGVPREENSRRVSKQIDNKVVVIKELPEDEKEDVLFNTHFGVRFIELNRPSKYNALTSSMIRKIVPRLQEWTKSDMANIIIIKGCGSRAFCAGGDVVKLVEQNRLGETGQKNSADYFALEYRMNHLIATYSKPYIAFMDGITMGGGAGLSIHAPIRIATEKTVFAMPETKIGLFPDIGASFFLPRLNGSIGTYLALTGERLEGINVFYSGIASHYIHSSSLHALELRLAELRFKDYESLEERLELINSTIEEFVTGIPYDQEMIISGERRKAIDRCFNKGSIISILAALEAEGGINKVWAEKTLKTLQSFSPTSLCVTLRLMQLGKKWSIAEAFKREHVLAARFMQKSDFNEGVDALLMRKDGSPKWNPPFINDIQSENSIVEPYFEVEGLQPIKLLNDIDFQQYPHNKYGVPSEEDVIEAIEGSGKGSREVIDHFLQKFKGKQGLKEVLEEIIERNNMIS